MSLQVGYLALAHDYEPRQKYHLGPEKGMEVPRKVLKNGSQDSNIDIV